MPEQNRTESRSKREISRHTERERERDRQIVRERECVYKKRGRMGEICGFVGMGEKERKWYTSDRKERV